MAAHRVAAARQTITRLQGVIKEAVHVKIYPRPRNLAESREVLRILESYGEVVMYKHLKYESVAPAHNTAIAIYQTAASAQKVIDASPIRFDLHEGKSDSSPFGQLSAGFTTVSGRPGDLSWPTGSRSQENQVTDNGLQVGSYKGPVADTGVRDLGASSGWDTSLSAFEAKVAKRPNCSPPASGIPPSKTFTPDSLPAQASNISAQIPVKTTKPDFSSPQSQPPREYQLTITQSNMDHGKYIERQGYYAGFNPDNKSMMAEDLEGRVPLAGLVDCQIRRTEAPARVVAKWREKAAQRTMTLKEIWENGKKERGEMK